MVSRILHFIPNSDNEIDLTAFTAYEDESDLIVDFEAMSKAELQQYAEAHGIAGVNKDKQTKAQMIAAIKEA